MSRNIYTKITVTGLDPIFPSSGGQINIDNEIYPVSENQDEIFYTEGKHATIDSKHKTFEQVAQIQSYPKFMTELLLTEGFNISEYKNSIATITTKDNETEKIIITDIEESDINETIRKALLTFHYLRDDEISVVNPLKSNELIEQYNENDLYRVQLKATSYIDINAIRGEFSDEILVRETLVSGSIAPAADVTIDSDVVGAEKVDGVIALTQDVDGYVKIISRGNNLIGYEYGAVTITFDEITFKTFYSKLIPKLVLSEQNDNLLKTEGTNIYTNVIDFQQYIVLLYLSYDDTVILQRYSKTAIIDFIFPDGTVVRNENSEEIKPDYNDEAIDLVVNELKINFDKSDQ